jgi:protein-tyrosine phosphatase
MLADIHNHLIYGVDDGAREEQDTMKLIDIARKNDTRIICFTPHVYPEYFGDNADAIVRHYRHIREIVGEMFPDMYFFLGSEIHYTPSTLSWIRDHKAFTMNGTDNVLIEFDTGDSLDKIIKAISQLLNNGFRPVIAHPERYVHFCSAYKEIDRMKYDGVLLQCDSGAFTGDFGFGQKHKGKGLLKRGLVDLIASDAHAVDGRNTDMSRCAALVKENYGERYFRSLFYKTPVEVLGLKDRRDS